MDVVVLPVSVPQAVPVQPVPVMLQVTPALLVSLVTVAVSGRFAPAFTVVLDGGAMMTETGSTVSVTELLRAGLATEVAVMVTNNVPDAVAGAV